MLTRRGFTILASVAAAAEILPPGPAAAATAGDAILPSTGARIPSVGLGTWITFNVGRDPAMRENCVRVMEAFFAEGGGMIDSSPMYGSSHEVVGHGLAALGFPDTLFAADKVWTGSGEDAPAQIAETRAKWRVPRFDLLQVHNLLAVEAHLDTLFAMKARGELGHVGVTTSHGRRHAELEAVMRRHPLDFVQLTYNAADREAEARLLPLAREKGIAVIANRPYRRGALTRRMAGTPLPGWAGEIGATSWAQILLKFVLSHPAMTVSIPATANVAHLRENKAAARDGLPDEALRRRIVEAVQAA